MAKDYDVGYGKPPRHSRFNKGRSGNSRGRPKASPNMQTEMKRLLATPTKIKVGGVIQTVSTSRAMCLALIQKAIAGDVRAFSKIVEIAGPEVANELKSIANDITANDLDILRRALARQDAEASNSPEAGPPTPREDNKK